MKHDFEDAPEYDAPAYQVAGWGSGIAFYVRGWEVVADADTEWSGFKVRTGRLVVTMVGDDARHLADPEDVTPLDRAAYCGQCGQVGCTHDGLDRSEEAAE